MSTTEKFCLKWNDFQENISSSFVSLREDNDFADVTLACEDGKQVKAHKVILAASSPFFQNLLKRNPHQHPLIYMRGVKSADLVAIVDFLYHGEVNVYQEDLDVFLAIAEELKIKGLAGEREDTKNADTPKQFIKKKEKEQEQVILKHEPETEISTTNYVENVISIPNCRVSVENNELNEQINSMIQKGDKKLKNGKRSSVCTVCGKEDQRSNIIDHIEANHIEGMTHPCSLCGKTFRYIIYFEISYILPPLS